VFKQTALLPEPQRFGRLTLEHKGTHAPLLHVRVPPPGCGGHVAHALPQSMVPAGQLPQTLPVQLAPVGQAMPQPPQLFASLMVAVHALVPLLVQTTWLGGQPHEPA
jgi:hypothetical protein